MRLGFEDPRPDAIVTAALFMRAGRLDRDPPDQAKSRGSWHLASVEACLLDAESYS